MYKDRYKILQKSVNAQNANKNNLNKKMHKYIIN